MYYYSDDKALWWLALLLSWLWVLDSNEQVTLNEWKCHQVIYVMSAGIRKQSPGKPGEGPSHSLWLRIIHTLIEGKRNVIRPVLQLY